MPLRPATAQALHRLYLAKGAAATTAIEGNTLSEEEVLQAVEGKLVVPPSKQYENRTPELQLVNPDLNEDIYDLIEQADLSPEQEEKLERELGKQYHLLTRDDRLETVAQDIVRHFLGRGFLGKAMVVSIDKATALRMHDKLRKFWESRCATTRSCRPSHGRTGCFPASTAG